jgi:hypothetical protein
VAAVQGFKLVFVEFQASFLCLADHPYERYVAQGSVMTRIERPTSTDVLKMISQWCLSVVGADLLHDSLGTRPPGCLVRPRLHPRSLVYGLGRSIALICYYMNNSGSSYGLQKFHAGSCSSQVERGYHDAL